MKLTSISLSFASAAALVSCVPMQTAPQSNYLDGYSQQDLSETIMHNGSPAAGGYWDGDGVTGKPLIRINIDEQKAFYFKGGQLVGISPLSTGIEGRETPKGTFRVTEKDIDHKSSLYGVIRDTATGQVVNHDAKVGRDRPGPGQVFERAPMLNFMRFNGAIGMHTGHLPGYAASHGCVRMPDRMAQIFYQNTPMGTTVIVE